MESLSFLVYLAAALMAILWYATVMRRRRDPGTTSRPLPGPFGLPIVGNLFFLEADLHAHLARLALTYGPIFRLKLGSKLGVVVTSPNLARQVLRDHDATFANRDAPAAAAALDYTANDIVWSSAGPTWRMLRRVCVRELLSPTSLDAVYGLRRREVRAAVRNLAATGGRRQPVDVGAEVFVTAMNVITSMIWGGTMEGEERGTVGREFRELVRDITTVVSRPNVSDFFPAVGRFDLQGVKREMAGLLVRFDLMFGEIMEQRVRKGSDDGCKDFLQYLLHLEAEGGDPKNPFTISHVKAILMDMVFGGTDTTSNTIEWAITELMHNPKIMLNLQAELDEVVGKDNILEESHIPKLRYLELVIKEVLRLHPALPFLVPHCPSSSCAIGGYDVPKGSRVFINVWAIHRDPSIWVDPLEFKPERFLAKVTGKDDYSSGNDFNYLPFGSGRRICAGVSMAERMIKYLLGSLLHSFDWEVPRGSKLDLSEKFGIILRKAEPLVAIPTPRLASHELYY